MIARKILLIGQNGQVGWELSRTLSLLGTVIAVDHPEFDLANPDSIREQIRKTRPQLIINAAAYTAVDKAEDEYEKAKAINATAPGIMAEEAGRLGAALIHYSTDYVFDGKKGTAYSETDTPKPINSYGETKLMGDQAIQAANIPHLIFRTSWVYGIRGNNFVRTILKLLSERDEISIVNDQTGSPTWSRNIAEVTGQVIAQRLTAGGEIDLAAVSGIYNLTAHGETSWYGFACQIAELARERHLVPKVGQINPIPSSAYPTPAQRPPYGVLNNHKLEQHFGLRTPNWETQLRLCLDQG